MLKKKNKTKQKSQTNPPIFMQGCTSAAGFSQKSQQSHQSWAEPGWRSPAELTVTPRKDTHAPINRGFNNNLSYSRGRHWPGFPKQTRQSSDLPVPLQVQAPQASTAAQGPRSHLWVPGPRRKGPGRHHSPLAKHTHTMGSRSCSWEKHARTEQSVL